MKKIVLTILAIIVFSAGYSQFTKGTILLGGSSDAGFSLTTNKIKANGTTTTDSKSNSFNLQPTAGYFIADNFAVGAGLDLSLSSNKDDGSSAKSSSTSIALAPFGRYYFSKLYAQVGLQLGSQKTKFTTGNGVTTESTDGITALNLGIGFPILLNESVAIEPLLGYRTITFKDKDTDNKFTSGGIFLSIGVYGYLGSLGKK